MKARLALLAVFASTLAADSANEPKTKTYAYFGAPAPKSGCGEFTLFIGATPYAENVGYKEGTCAAHGYSVPDGTGTGNFALPKTLGAVGEQLTVHFFAKATLKNGLRTSRLRGSVKFE